MPNVYVEGLHPYVTIIMDRTGCIHLFEGRQNPSNSRSCPIVDGQEAETFIQRQEDIETLLEYLSEDEQKDVIDGWAIQTRNIPEDYLVHE